MTLTAILLLLVSAGTHAGWNLLSKRNNPNAASFLIACLTGTLMLAPCVFAYKETLEYFSRSSSLLVFATGLFQAIYYIGLVGAYRTGHMSIAYPLARSSPAVLVTVVGFLLERSDQISPQCLYGIVLIVVGAFLLPMRRFGEFRWCNYVNLSCLFALLAAFGTTGYSMIDDEALRLLREAPNASLPSWQITLVYAFFEAMSSTFWLVLFVVGRKRERHMLRQVVRKQFPSAAFMGVGIYLTYSLVLISMAFVTNVSYVVAFRQLSIPLGVVLSIWLLKEPAYIPKLVAVVIMFIGLILVGTG
jgi:drug/metabolite transporter (DMT)-like permease